VDGKDRPVKRVVTRLTTALMALAVGAQGVAGAGGAQPSGGERQRAMGRELYAAHCASCHGASGRGDGPVADSLRRRPADLTQFSRANGGVFPSERIRRVIDGRGVGAHGSVEMPVWGTVFKATSPDGEPGARQRIDAIVAFLQAIQERPGDDP
jgi:mono/diheme cytochrome c family protein